MKPNYSLGEFVFDTSIQRYLNHKKYTVIINEDSIVGTMYEFIEPKISVFIDNRNLIESVTCDYKCYLYGKNIINLNIDYVIKEIIKTDPDLVETLWTFYKDKEVQERVYDFNCLGAQIWVYRNKIVTVVCSNLDDTTGPARCA